MRRTGPDARPRGWRAAWTSPWLRVAVSAVLLGFIALKVDLAGALALVRRCDPLYLMLALALGVVQTFVSAWRWHTLMAGHRAQVPFGWVVRTQFVSAFVGFFLPGGVGVEVIRIYSLSRLIANSAMSVSSILVERSLATLVLLVLVLGGLAVVPLDLPAGITWLSWATLAALLGGGMAAMNGAVRAATLDILEGARLGRIAHALRLFFASLDSYRERPVMLVWAVPIAFLHQGLRIAVAVVAGWSLGLSIPLSMFAVVMPIVLLLSLLPLSIGGVGMREVASVSLFGLAGVAPDAAFALAALVSLLTVASVLPGAWFYIDARRRSRMPAAAVA